MSPDRPAKMDVRTAWNTWTASGSPEAAAEFLHRVEPWMDGTAAQLSRGGVHHSGPRMTREEVADRLRFHLGVMAEGQDVTYVEALDLARRHVIEELRSRFVPRAQSPGA